jgi:hypothetical protein
MNYFLTPNYITFLISSYICVDNNNNFMYLTGLAFNLLVLKLYGLVLLFLFLII